MVAACASIVKMREWSVEHLVLRSPKGDVLEIKSTSLFVVAELLHKSTSVQTKLAI